MSSSTTTTTEAAPSSSTSSPTVHDTTLPPGTREVATAKDDRSQVSVLASPPSGWDSTLSPVVRAERTDPPRRGDDAARPALPSPSYPIPGRTATAQGWSFDHPGRYSPAQPLVFSVVQRQGPWLQVELPVRPNGTLGYLRAEDVQLSTTDLEVVVELGARRLRLLDGGQLVSTSVVAVGSPATPTPTGSFFVTDVVPSLDPNGPYGPVALALNGYSESMDELLGDSAAGSPDERAPVLAIHGTNRPGSLGLAASNGCPRLANDEMLRLAAAVAPGTPVTIWP